jgi:hypothetical protein
MGGADIPDAADRIYDRRLHLTRIPAAPKAPDYSRRDRLCACVLQFILQQSTHQPQIQNVRRRLFKDYLRRP